jgi:hypothetical protein
VEAKEVGVAEVWSYFGWDVGSEDGIEEEVKVCVDDLVIESDKAAKCVDGVGDDAVRLTSRKRLDCSADVPWK